MTTLTERAEKVAKGNAGYRYNPEILTSICVAGYNAIPSGTVIGSQGGQVLTLVDGVIVCAKDGVVTKRTELTTDEMRESVVVAYAVTASKL
jgi:hypothetical protein